MKIGLIQTKHTAMCNFLDSSFVFTKEQCVKMQREGVQQALNLLGDAANGGYDLLVTTECINYIRTSNRNISADKTLYPALDCAEVHALSLAAKNANSWLVAGFGYNDGKNAYNAALIFDRGGALTDIYRKIYLAGDEENVFTSGDKFVTVNADFGRFGVCICWDLQQPETARQLAHMGADIVVCPTWGYEQNLYGRARAYENGIYLAAAMAVPAWGSIDGERTPSSVAAPNGEVLCVANKDKQQLLSCELSLEACRPFKKMRLYQNIQSAKNGG